MRKAFGKFECRIDVMTNVEKVTSATHERELTNQRHVSSKEAETDVAIMNCESVYGSCECGLRNSATSATVDDVKFRLDRIVAITLSRS
jgi:hypothetical protein